MRHLGACLAVALVFAAVLWVGSAPSFGLVPQLNRLEVEASFVYVEQNSDWYASMFWRSDKADLATGPMGTGFGFSHSGLADATVGFQFNPPLVQRGGDLPVLGISCRSMVGARGTQAMGEGGASFGTIPTVYHTVYPLRPDYEAPGVLAADDMSTDWLRVEVGLRLTGNMALYLYAGDAGGWVSTPRAGEMVFDLHPSLMYDAWVTVVEPVEEEDPYVVQVWLSVAGQAEEKVYETEVADPETHYQLTAGISGEATVFRRLTHTSVREPRWDPLNYDELAPYLDIAQWRMESFYAMARPGSTADQLMIRPRLKRLYFAARHHGGDGGKLIGVDFQQLVRLAKWHFPGTGGSEEPETGTLPGLGWEDNDGLGNSSQLDPSGLSRWELTDDIIMVTESRLQPAGGFWFFRTQEVYAP